MFCGCEETVKSSTGIYKIEIEDLSNEHFYCGSTSDEYAVNIYGASELVEDNINVVIEDDSIINIAYEKKYSYIDDIYFTIQSLKEGTTTFYFESSDKIIKSEPVTITVENNIISISFSDNDEIVFDNWKLEETLFFDLDTYDDIENTANHLEFISEDTDIATIANNENSWLNSCTIKAVDSGQTYVYIQSLDGKVKSPKIKITVEEEPTEAPTKASVEDTYTDNSRTVYITPTGKKYHFSSACAGENAIERTEDSVKNSYSPCSKCAY